MKCPLHVKYSKIRGLPDLAPRFPPLGVLTGMTEVNLTGRPLLSFAGVWWTGFQREQGKSPAQDVYGNSSTLKCLVTHIRQNFQNVFNSKYLNYYPSHQTRAPQKKELEKHQNMELFSGGTFLAYINNLLVHMPHSSLSWYS